MNSEEIFELMRNQPELKKEEDRMEGLKKLAEQIGESEDRSLDNIVTTAIKLFKVEERNEEKRQKISSISFEYIYDKTSS